MLPAFMFALAATAAGPLPAAPAQAALLREAQLMIVQHRPAEAIVKLDAAIAGFEGEPTDKAVYCARTLQETLAVLLEATAAKRDAIVVDATRCDVYFLKGFALVDLGQSEAARALLERAVAMGPHNPQYRNELAESYKASRDWAKSNELFLQAAADARTYFEPNSFQLRRAMRGVGFTLIELGKLAEAEAMFNDVLKLDPSDERAKNELEYIRQQRSQTRPAT